MSAKRVLVTGASGFVGANLVRRLLADGHRVAVILRPERDPWRISELTSHVELLADNILHADLRSRLIRFGPEWVFHLATYGAYPWQDDLRLAAETNFTGTVNLLDACLATGFDVFVNTGSSSEYGSKDHAPAESEALEPASYYSVTKAASSMLCRHIGLSQGARIVTLRLYSVYGPYEEPPRLIPQLLAAGLDGRLPALANPRTARDFVHVDDVCEAYLSVARSGAPAGAVYNVGTARQTRLEELVGTVCKLLTVSDPPRWGTYGDRPWDTGTWVANIDRIWADVRWRPSIDLEKGLSRTIAWLEENPAALGRYRAAEAALQ